MPLTKSEIESTIIAAAQAIAKENGVASDAVHADTEFFGANGIFDSLTLVHLIVEVEQRLEAERQAAVVLTDERAMSATVSPFRSCRTMTDYVHQLVSDSKNG